MIVTPLQASRWPDLHEIRAVVMRQTKIDTGRLLVLTQAEVNELREYSSTEPGDVYVGKRWKRNCHPRCIAARGPSGMKKVDWLIGTYIKNPAYLGAWMKTIHGEVPALGNTGNFPRHNTRRETSPILIQWSHVEITS